MPAEKTMKTLVRMAQAAGLFLALITAAAAEDPLKIATSAGPVGQLASYAAKLAKEKGLDVKIVELSDWVRFSRQLRRSFSIIFRAAMP